MDLREGNKHLSTELKSKIIHLKNFTLLTDDEIALQCNCSVTSLLSFFCVFLLIFVDLAKQFYISFCCFFICYIKRRTVARWWSRYVTTDNVSTYQRTGRKRITTQQTDRDIFGKSDNNPFMPAVKIAEEFNLSKTTIARRLNERGIHCQVAATQTRLTDDHKIYRLAFCEQMLERFDNESIKNLIFTDEKTFSTDLQKRTLVYRPPNTRYEPKYVTEQTLSGRITNCFWGAIGNKKSSFLFCCLLCITKNLNLKLLYMFFS